MTHFFRRVFTCDLYEVALGWKQEFDEKCTKVAFKVGWFFKLVKTRLNKLNVQGDKFWLFGFLKIILPDIQTMKCVFWSVFFEV